MSQQLDRAGVRPDGSAALLTYTGQVMLVANPEIGKTGNERPRKIVISDRPGSYQGKTFRIWAWKEDQFSKLKVGEWVTVHYEIEPNPDPTRHGSNHISVVEPTTAQGGGQADVGGEVSGSQPASQPTREPGDWSTPPSGGWANTKQELSKDDYWARREATDAERTLEIESAWAINAVLQTSTGLTDEQVIDKALQLVILKRRLASELGRG